LHSHVCVCVCVTAITAEFSEIEREGRARRLEPISLLDY
jgi:hypothetical protein